MLGFDCIVFNPFYRVLKSGSGNLRRFGHGAWVGQSLGRMHSRE